jgi:hypothetical protein
MRSTSDGAERKSGYNPIGAARISNKGFLPMTPDQYLPLLDTLGRVVREGKCGFIPAELPPILARLEIEPHAWLDTIPALFRGSPNPRPSLAVAGSSELPVATDPIVVQSRATTSRHHARARIASSPA